MTDRADATAPDDDPDPSSEWFPSTVRDYVQTHDGRVPRATRSCFGLDRIPDPVDPSTRGGDACVSTHDDTDRPDLSVVSDADESTASGTTDSRPVSSSDRSTDAPAARWRRGVWTSRTIERLAADNGLTELESAAFLGRKDLRRDHAKRGLDRLLAWGSSLFIRYGEGYGRVVGWGVAVVAAFTLVYPTGGWIAAVGDGDPTRITWSAIADDPSLLWASLYYSTLTFTNLGFGDYRPTNALGQFLTVAETSVGVVLLALLVFVVGRRSAR